MTETHPNIMAAPAWAHRAMIDFFGQFERALPGFVPVMSEDDRSTTARDLTEVGSKAWWDRLIRASDGKVAAIEFRERMRIENASRSRGSFR